MTWSLTSSQSEGTTDTPSVRLTLPLGGRSRSVELADADAALLRRVLPPYLERICDSDGGTSEIAKVRLWAQVNGYAVAERGRVARSVLDAYNAAHDTEVQDRWAKRRPRSFTIDEIETLKERARRSPPGIKSTVWIVDEEGRSRRFEPNRLADPLSSTTPAGPSSRGMPRPMGFSWPR